MKSTESRITDLLLGPTFRQEFPDAAKETDGKIRAIIESDTYFWHAPYMLEVIKRTWLKLNCGLDNEPDSAIANSCWDNICNVMGTEAAIAWADEAIPDEP